MAAQAVSAGDPGRLGRGDAGGTADCDLESGADMTRNHAMTEQDAEILLKKEVDEAKTAHQVDLAVTAWLRRMAGIEERKAKKE
jgi:hypothetical protein